MEQTCSRSIYQINTRVWLHELSQELGHQATLAEIPDSRLDLFARLGFGWVWLLGIWNTGPAGQKVSATNPSWRGGCEETLGSDLRDEDICGSPFAIKEYVVHPDFGGNQALRLLRDRLRHRGVRLLLDFVPNHTALDHLWVWERPEFYVNGTESELVREPNNYYTAETATGPRVLAYGRDPNYNGWPDTLQLNYRHPGLREAMREQLLRIAKMCDGVRCDMAMLILPEIFNRTWGELSRPRDGIDPVDSAFWPEAITSVRQQHSDFIFAAEVYWDLDFALQRQGFDYTYDKGLYDRLADHNANGEAVRSHLSADIDYQKKLVRFLENHDERRAASTFSPRKHRAAAVLTFLTPGLRLFHEGQLEGRKIKVSIHLTRRPVEPVDLEVKQFYDYLLRCIVRPEIKNGCWQLLECRPAWDGNASWKQFVASSWEGENGGRLLVVANYAPSRGQCYVELPFSDMGGKRFRLRDLLSSSYYERNGDDLAARGLYLDMPEWGYHAFELLGTIIAVETPGMILRHTLRGHEGVINRIAWSPDGRKLASGSNDRSVRIWDSVSGEEIHSFKGQRRTLSIAWSPDGKQLATGGADGSVRIWSTERFEEIRSLAGHKDWVNTVAWRPGPTPMLVSGSADKTMRIWDALAGEERHRCEHPNNVFSVACSPDGRTVASACADNTVRLWDAHTGKQRQVLEGHAEQVLSVAWAPGEGTLVSASTDDTVRVWDPEEGRLLAVLELHTNDVRAVAFSFDGCLLATKGADDMVLLWRRDSWQVVAELPEPSGDDWLPGLAFHPRLPVLATLGEDDTVIRVWDLRSVVLLGKALPPGVHHTTAKIVLVGDSGVGKTGLGWRLAHGAFKEHFSTHGQQFWVVNQLSARRRDGTECEAILWDLAGQPDYRLIHALFLDDADLALVLFDPTDSRDPLHGVEFWLKQLIAAQGSRPAAQQAKSKENRLACPAILVGARADRGEARLSQEELDAFCHQSGITGGYLSTSAITGDGLKELLRRMQAEIQWDERPATVTTVTFKRVKDYVLGLKEKPDERHLIVSQRDLREQLERTDERWDFTDAEMMTAVKHLSKYGYVRVLRTSKSEERILLAPELLNNLAASFVLEARRNPKGLGLLEEKRLLSGEYPFRELEELSQEERDVLLDSAALLFLEHNICFRETDLSGNSYLVFPELINLKKPQLEDKQSTEDGVGYTISGAVENVYASLVVLLGYTPMFTRTNQWRNEARYEVGDGLICGFRQDGERDGELELVLYFGKNVGSPARTLFRGLFESFLARRNLSVFRYEPVICGKCRQPLDRAVVRDRLRGGKDFAYCPECSEKLALPKAHEPIQLRQEEQRKVDEQRWFADRRSRFEQAVFQLASYVETQKLARPECFISYAWGDKDQERWVERNLASDLQKAGVDVLLDRWENARVGASVMRFVERIHQCDKVIVVGTPAYGKKYANKEPEKGFVVAAEGDLIAPRMLSTEAKKESVLPLLLAGDTEESLPPWLHGRVHADFRNERDYFTTAFDLFLNLYGISHGNPAVADLRESLREREMR